VGSTYKEVKEVMALHVLGIEPVRLFPEMSLQSAKKAMM
jgi:hypothetical protein